MKEIDLKLAKDIDRITKEYRYCLAEFDKILRLLESQADPLYRACECLDLFQLPVLLKKGNDDAYYETKSFFEGVFDATRGYTAGPNLFKVEQLLYVVEDILYLLEEFMPILYIPPIRRIQVFKKNV